MHVLSVKMSPESQLIFISDLQWESCDIKTYRRIGKCSDALLGDVGNSATFKTYKLKALRLKMRWRKKWLKIFSSLYYTNFTAAKVWQENEKNYSVIHMNWSVFPKYHPGNSLSINTLAYLTNIREFRRILSCIQLLHCVSALLGYV